MYVFILHTHIQLNELCQVKHLAGGAAALSAPVRRLRHARSTAAPASRKLQQPSFHEDQDVHNSWQKNACRPSRRFP